MDQVVKRIFQLSSTVAVFETNKGCVKVVDLMNSASKTYLFDFTVKKVVSSGKMLFFLTFEGELFAWGVDSGKFGLFKGNGYLNSVPVKIEFEGFLFSDAEISSHHAVSKSFKGRFVSWGADFYGETGSNRRGNQIVSVLESSCFDGIKVVEFSASDNFTLFLSENRQLYYLGKLRSQQSGSNLRRIISAKVKMYSTDSESLFIYTQTREFHLISDFHIKFELDCSPQNCWFFDSFLFLQTDSQLIQVKDGNVVEELSSVGANYTCYTPKLTACTLTPVSLNQDSVSTYKSYIYTSILPSNATEHTIFSRTFNTFSPSKHYLEPQMLTEGMAVTEDNLYTEASAFEMLSSTGSAVQLTAPK